MNWYLVSFVVFFILLTLGGAAGSGPKHVHGESLEDWTKRYKKRVSIGNVLLAIGFFGDIGTIIALILSIG